MGNMCAPKRIYFTKISTTPRKCDIDIKIKQSVSERRKQKSGSSIRADPDSGFKDAIMESLVFNKDRSKRRFSILSDDSITISRKGSVNEFSEPTDNNSTDSAPETFINSTLSSRNSSPLLFLDNASNNLDVQIGKRKLKNRFMEICLSQQLHNDRPIEELKRILEYASRANYADVIDCKNDENNTAISVAILENNYPMLLCLMHFLPDFPEYLTVNTYSVPLVQVAAITNTKSDQKNMLSVILKRWMDDPSYFSIALRNVSTKNLNSETLLEFLISEIFISQMEKQHFYNLELLFQLFKLLQIKEMFTVETHKPISHLCSIISLGVTFWTEDRRQRLLSIRRLFDTNVGNYINIIVAKFKRTN